MSQVMTGKTTCSIDGIIVGTHKGVDRQKNVDRNGMDRVDGCVPNLDESEGTEVEELMRAADDWELSEDRLKYRLCNNISVIAKVARVEFDASLREIETVVLWTVTGSTRGKYIENNSNFLLSDDVDNTAYCLPLSAEDRSIRGILANQFGVSASFCWPLSSLPLL